MLRILALLVLATLPDPAQSGAWPREKGGVFLSWSSTVSVLSDTGYEVDNSLYAEYGLTSRMTVGFDGYLGATGNVSEGFVFLLLPVGKTDQRARMALTFAMGQKSIPNPWGTTTKQSLAKIGLSWGRGLDHGWLAIDAYATAVVHTSLQVPGQSGPEFSADFTWGQKPSDRLMLIWQLQAGKPSNGLAYVKFAPSLVWSIGATKSTQIELGLIKGLTGDESQSLKLGFWKSF